METAQDGPGDMQARVQAAVLRMVADESGIHLAKILRTLPRANERDVARAVHLLVEKGYLDLGGRVIGDQGQVTAVYLTERGRKRLGS
jgi:hypothetical protein